VTNVTTSFSYKSMSLRTRHVFFFLVLTTHEILTRTNYNLIHNFYIRITKITVSLTLLSVRWHVYSFFHSYGKAGYYYEI